MQLIAWLRKHSPNPHGIIFQKTKEFRKLEVVQAARLCLFGALLYCMYSEGAQVLPAMVACGQDI